MLSTSIRTVQSLVILLEQQQLIVLLEQQRQLVVPPKQPRQLVLTRRPSGGAEVPRQVVYAQGYEYGGGLGERQGLGTLRKDLRMNELRGDGADKRRLEE